MRKSFLVVCFGTRSNTILAWQSLTFSPLICIRQITPLDAIVIS